MTARHRQGTLSGEPLSVNRRSDVPKSNAIERRALIAKRRADVIELRNAGVDAVTIGRQLGYGRWHPSADLPPEQRQQISSDASLARMVRQDIARALEDRRTDLVLVADEMRLAQTERLERLHAALWPEALKRDPVAVGGVLRIADRMAKLWGLDKPVRVAVDHTVVAAEVEAAVIELVQLVHENPPAESAPHRPALEA